MYSCTFHVCMYMYSRNVLIKKCIHVISKSSEQTIHPSCDSDSQRFLLILCACSVCGVLQVTLIVCKFSWPLCETGSGPSWEGSCSQLVSQVPLTPKVLMLLVAVIYTVLWQADYVAVDAEGKCGLIFFNLCLNENLSVIARAQSKFRLRNSRSRIKDAVGKAYWRDEGSLCSFQSPDKPWIWIDTGPKRP